MAANRNLIQTYASSNTWRRVPDNLQALGEIIGPDETKLLSIAFTTHRDIISEIGYCVCASCPITLSACAAVICQLAKDKAVMAAELLGPDDIASILSDDGNLDDQTYYNSILAVMAFKNAVSSYAAYKADDFKVWKAHQAETF